MGALGYLDYELFLRDALYLGLYVARESDLQRHIGVVGEVSAVDHHLLARAGIFTAHVVDTRCRHEYVELIVNGSPLAGDESCDVGNLAGEVIGDVDDDGMARHHVGIELCLLVVEPYLLHVAHVVAHEAYAGSKGGTDQERVALVDVTAAGILDDGGLALVVFGVRLLARAQSAAQHQGPD